MKKKMLAIPARIIVALIAASLLLAACAPRQGTNRQPGQTQMQQGQNLQGQDMQGQFNPGADMPDGRPVVPENMSNTGIQVPEIRQQDMANYKQKADRIKNSITKMGEVDTANVVVVGNTCLVGYKPTRQSKGPDTTKNMITGRVKEMDNTIQNVICSESGDAMDRISRMSKDIANNRPAEELNSEFKQLMNSLMPEVR